MRSVSAIIAAALVAVSAGCSAGTGGESTPLASTPPPTPTGVLGSSKSSSGALGLFTKEGASYVVTPVSSGAAPLLLTFPNTGLAVGAITVNQIQATPISTSLNRIDGTSVDPVHDIGVAFGTQDGTVSLFALSTAS